VDYFLVLGVLLVSSIAGLSCIFRQALACLRRCLSPCFPEEISRGAIIAALLAYRALYYFLPLLATIGYLILESRAKHLREKTSASWRKRKSPGRGC
jgi:uncharacterized membrane protein YbhN (UPF0104 family)